MTLGNMRQQGVRGLAVHCLNHACSKSMRARPNWKERTSKAHVVRMMQYPHDIREEVLKIVFERFEEASLVAATQAPTQIASAQIIKKVRYEFQGGFDE
jgi:hypothetical protein